MGEQIGSPDDATSFIATRHSIKPKGEDNPSEEYKGISEKGVELAREQAQKWLEVLKNAPEKAVLLLARITYTGPRIPTPGLRRTSSGTGRV